MIIWLKYSQIKTASVSDLKNNLTTRLKLVIVGEFEITAQWTEVAPTIEVRDRAIRLLRVHPLRAADAFQLAVALIFCREKPQHLTFLTADQRLGAAAAAEGFAVA